MSLDASSRARLLTGYPDLAVRAYRLIEDVRNHLALQVRITEVIRTIEYQEKLYSKGRVKLKSGVWQIVDRSLIVTNAPPGSSIHHFGLAFDIAFVGADPYLEAIRKHSQVDWDKLWRRVGEFGKAHGLVWGYDWNGNGIKDKNDFDRPHFQITYGQTLGEIQELYRFGGMAAVWAAMDKIRGVEQGSEWNGILTKRALADIGVLV